jgi:hypothetical protein
VAHLIHAMKLPPTALERAFELARSGGCAGLADIRRSLRAEGFSDKQVYGRSLQKQLMDLCKKSGPASVE